MLGTSNVTKLKIELSKLIQSIFWTLLVRVLLIIAGFLSSIVTARFLGPEGRGVFFYWTTLAALAIQFGNLGLHSSNTYYLAKGRAKLSSLAANSLWVSFIAGGLLAGLLAGGFWLFSDGLQDKIPFLLPVLSLIPFGLYFLLGSNILIGDGRIGEYNGFEILNRYLSLGAIFFAAWFWRSPEVLLIVTACGSAVVCLLLFIRLRTLDKSSGPSLSLIREGFGYSIRAYLAAALGFVVLRLNTVLLGQYVDANTLGNWSIAAQVIDIIVVLPGAIALVLLPKIMRSDEPYRLMKSQVRLVACIMLPLCLAVVGVGEQVISLVYGKGFSKTYEMLLWGLPGAVCLGLISIISQYLAAVGIPVKLIWIWFAGAIFEVVAAICVIPMLGGEGAMIVLSTTYLFVLIMLWSLAWKHQSNM